MTDLNVPNRSMFCRDNLDILRGINSNCIDLIYLDPPFNKKKKFTAPTGSSAEGAEFSDIFTEEDVKNEWIMEIKEDYDDLHALLTGAKQFGGIYNYCYLCYMAIRLIECHRILKPTGSVYLHCDPTMSHYLKLVMDCIFGEKNFRNEIIWFYKTGGTSKRWFAKKHDVLLFFSKGGQYLFNQQKEKSYLAHKYGFSNVEISTDEQGDYTVVGCRDVWDIPALRGNQPETKSYPTQKPLALLQRIIAASSNPGDVVLDPFCGCATTCVGAEAMGRQWIGIDISHKAYQLVRERIQETDGLLLREDDCHYQTSPPKRTDSGYDYRPRKHVYIISNPRNKQRLKVGIASNLESRLSSYQTGDPDRGFKVEYSVQTPHFRELEQHIHKMRENDLEWVYGTVDEIKEDMTEFLQHKD